MSSCPLQVDPRISIRAAKSTILDGWNETTLLGHIATNVPENDVDGSASQSLEFGIIFMLTDSCQQAV
jgi:hypothetical protein